MSGGGVHTSSVGTLLGNARSVDDEAPPSVLRYQLRHEDDPPTVRRPGQFRQRGGDIYWDWFILSIVKRRYQ